MINIIVAETKDHIIGNNNKLPWSYKEDLHYFKRITSGDDKIVIMGFNTWKSIGKKLPNRINVYIDRNIDNIKCIEENLYAVNSLKFGLEYFTNLKKYNIFIIGGEKIYKEALENHNIDKIYLTRINKKISGDKYFQPLYEKYRLISVIKGINPDLEFREYIRTNKRPEEYQYFDIIKNILKNGHECDDRTGTGILSHFGAQMRFNLEEGYPLLTTKKVFFRGVITELLWFLRGSTDAKELQKKNVHIWDGNTNREFLDNLGFKDREEGDGGPIYGHNFRHYGAKYENCHTDYTNLGVDQVKEVLRGIKETPNSRRLLINLWNPSDLKEVVLPPCHVLYQFRVYGDKLSCSMYQRSGDLGLGIPFNIASAALMTHIFAFLTNKIPGELVHSIGDAHIYKNHINALKKQIERKAFSFPLLKINENNQTSVEDFRVEDFNVLGYDAHKNIKMKMAV